MTTTMYWNLSTRERLITALELAKNEKVLEQFLIELLTEKELKTLENKLTAACMLKDAAPHRQITFRTKLSSTTICKLQHNMRNHNSGIQKILRKFLARGKSYSE